MAIATWKSKREKIELPLVLQSLAVALILAWGAACAPVGDSVDETKRAEPRIEKSFSTKTADGSLGVASHKIVIQKSALGKDFLFHGAVIPQTEAATGHSLKARVVSFIRNDSDLFLMESPEGLVVTKDLPSRLILARMPVIDENDASITFDFNAGMDNVFLTGHYHSSDSNGTDFHPQYSAAKVKQSFLASASVHDNTLDIRQIAQIQEEDALVSNEIRYYLTPYVVNAGFTSRETSDFKWVGYFEVAPVLETETGYTRTRISHWDTRKPIVYSISANTPAHLVDSIKDGILYWNKALGGEIIKVQMAPEGVTAPDPRFNLIQWVPNDSAGVAYADMQEDPRTGEILHAQVFLTSVFDVSARSKLPGRIRKIKTELNPTNPPKAIKHVWEGDSLCSYPALQTLQSQLDTFVAKGANQLSDDQLMKIARDYIRVVVAHEVGHTLGLRHNFAGSLAGNITSLQRDQFFLDYVLEGKVPTEKVKYSSSVMEYSTFFEDVLISADAKERGTILPYDKAAIEWGYAGKEIDTSTASLFCTDTHVGKYVDCLTFDSGPSPLVDTRIGVNATLLALPASLVEEFVLAKTARDPKLRKSFKNVELDPKKLSDDIIAQMKSILAWFGPKGVSSLKVDRLFDFRSSFNEKEALLQQRNWVNAQISLMGTVEEVLFPFLPTEKGSIAVSKMSTERLKEYLAKPENRTGIGYDGKTYQLTDEEVKYIEEMGEIYFRKLETKLITESLKLMSETVFSKEIFAEAIEKALGVVATRFVLAVPETFAGAKDVGTGVADDAFLKFYFPKEIREAAILLVLPKMGEWVDWSFEARNKIRTQLVDLVKKAAKVEDAAKVDLADGKFNRAQRQWLMEQAALIALLGKS